MLVGLSLLLPPAGSGHPARAADSAPAPQTMAAPVVVPTVVTPPAAAAVAPPVTAKPGPGAGAAAPAPGAPEPPPPELTLLHGLAVAALVPGALLVATDRGMFLATGGNSLPTRLGDSPSEVRALAASPSDPNHLYASGRLAPGAELALLSSTDGGQTWSQSGSDPTTRGAGLTALAASPATPELLYGLAGNVVRSSDGGRSWTTAGRTPQPAYDLVAAPGLPERLFAATRHGVMVSRDGGRSWAAVLSTRHAATVIRLDRSGSLVTYIVGDGFSRSNDGTTWQKTGPALEHDAVLHLEPDLVQAGRYYASTISGALLVSADGGASWQPFAPPPAAEPGSAPPRPALTPPAAPPSAAPLPAASSQAGPPAAAPRPAAGAPPPLPAAAPLR